jgi:CRISPR/Cas system endoribonuclease Cas6 (RAMP superfamily)
LMRFDPKAPSRTSLSSQDPTISRAKTFPCQMPYLPQLIYSRAVLAERRRLFN